MEIYIYMKYRDYRTAWRDRRETKHGNKTRGRSDAKQGVGMRHDGPFDGPKSASKRRCGRSVRRRSADSCHFVRWDNRPYLCLNFKWKWKKTRDRDIFFNG